MGNPYRQSGGRVSSGMPNSRVARPRQGGGQPAQPLPPIPRAGDAPPGTPLGTPGWRPTPPIVDPNGGGPGAGGGMGGGIPTGPISPNAGQPQVPGTESGNVGGQMNVVNQGLRQGIDIDGEEAKNRRFGGSGGRRGN